MEQSFLEYCYSNGSAQSKGVELYTFTCGCFVVMDGEEEVISETCDEDDCRREQALRKFKREVNI